MAGAHSLFKKALRNPRLIEAAIVMAHANLPTSYHNN